MVKLAKTRNLLTGLGPLFIISFLLATVSAPATGSDIRNPREFFFTQSFGDLPEELQTAKKQGKQGMFLFFEADDCIYCKAMLKHVLSQKEVQDWYREHFLSIAIDIHGDVEIKDFDGITLPSKVFAGHRRVSMTPVLSFIDLNGSEIYRHLGMVKSPEEFLLMGEYIVDEHYLDTEFKVFSISKGIEDSADTLVTPVQKGSK
jgi:thioredoxin-related protein